MLLILKYSGVIFCVSAVFALAIIFAGSSVGNKMEVNYSEQQIQPDETSIPYKIYFIIDRDRFQSMYLLKGKAELYMIYSGKSKFTIKVFNPDGIFLTYFTGGYGHDNRKHLIDIPENANYLINVDILNE